jgi:hypothetical protein
VFSRHPALVRIHENPYKGALSDYLGCARHVVDGVLEFLRTVAYDLLVAQQVGAPIRPSVVSGGGRATTTVSASTDTICTTSSILHVALSGVTSATTPNRQAMKTMRVDFFFRNTPFNFFLGYTPLSF